MPGTLLSDLLIILAAGLFAAIVCKRLGMSVLVGYLLVGVLLGDGCLGWVRDEQDELERIAEGGVFLLLFSIGLEFSINELLRLGRNLIIGGSAQMLLVAVPVASYLMATGVSWQPAMLIAAAVSFSSTVLVFRGLSEWGHSSLPHGRRAVGILLFQDAALVPLLLLVPILTGSGKVAGPTQYITLAIVSIVFVSAVAVLRYVLAKWVIPMFARYRSAELVVLFTLVALGAVTLAAYKAGLPPAIGAFAAGLIFSGNRWTKQIDALVLPFRESFAAVFFVSLGMLLDPQMIVSDPIGMPLLLVGLIVLKACAATIALRLTGLRWRAAAGMGIGLAHVGEFAFVLVMLGEESGVIGQDDYQRLVALAIGSLILTPVLLTLGLRWTGSSEEASEAEAASGWHDILKSAVVIGAGPIGRQVTSRLETGGRDVCLVDLSPLNLQPFAQQGMRTVAGDATETGILELAQVPEASLIVVCLPDDDASLRVAKSIRSINADCVLLVRCRFQANVQSFIKAGVNKVVSEESQASLAFLKLLESTKSTA